MRHLSALVVVAVLLGTFVAAGCGQTAPPPAPTAAPAAKAAEPAKAAAPAAPTKVAEPTKAPAAAAPTKAPEPAKKVDFPTKGKPVNIIVPVTAGGVADNSARILASLLEKELGTSFPVVNKAGASSLVGMTEVANAKPDGYTLGVILLPTTTVTYLDPDMKATYTRKAFQPVALFVEDVITCAVHPGTPFKSMKDLADLAKANPEKYKMTTSGLLSVNHMGGIAFEQAAGVKFAFVHFPGGNEGNTAVLGGHADGQFNASGNTAPHHKTGALRVLGTMGKEKWPFLPDVPTVAEQGYKAYASVTYGFVAPAGTPPEIVDVLSQAVKKAAATEEYKTRLAAVNMIPRYLDPAAFDKHLIEVEEWATPLVKAGKQK